MRISKLTLGILLATILPLSKGVAETQNTVTQMSKVAINAINGILACPAEILEVVSSGAQWVGEATIQTGKNGSVTKYRFARQTGFNSSEAAGTLKITRTRVSDHIQDGAPFSVNCEVTQDQNLHPLEPK